MRGQKNLKKKEMKKVFQEFCGSQLVNGNGYLLRKFADRVRRRWRVGVEHRQQERSCLRDQRRGDKIKKK